jgi:hypothetical protein
VFSVLPSTLDPELCDFCGLRTTSIFHLRSTSCILPITDDVYGIIVELERISSTNHNTATTLSATISGAGPRHASGGEVAYLQRLVDTYGTDVERMARDRKVSAALRVAHRPNAWPLAEPGAEDGWSVVEEYKKMLRCTIVIEVWITPCILTRTEQKE